MMPKSAGPTARIEPNRRCHTSMTFRSGGMTEMNRTPRATETAKNTPIATSEERTVRSRTKAMPMEASRVKGTAMSRGCSSQPLVPKNAAAKARRAIPPKAAWARPSPRKARPRCTTNVPSRPANTAMARPHSRARCMKGRLKASSSSTSIHQLVVLVPVVTVSFLEGLVGEDLLRGTETVRLAVEDQDVTGVIAGGRKVVSDHHDGSVRALLVALEQVVQVVFTQEVHAGRGLVEQDQVGLANEGAGEVDALEFSA